MRPCLRTALGAFCLFSASLSASGDTAAWSRLASDPLEREPRSGWADLDGSLRVRATALPGFGLDGAGASNDQQRFLETRLRVGGRYEPRDWLGLRLQLDAVNGIVAGDLTRLGTAAAEGLLDYPLDRTAFHDPVQLRLAYATIRLPFGQLRLGQQAFSWGLGLLANDGEGEPDFGDRRGGSLVERVAFATKPAPGAGGLLGTMTVFLAGDLVWRDPNADFRKGDRAFSGVAGVRADDGLTALGLFSAVRRQTDRADANRPGEASVTTVSTTDVFASLRLAALGGERQLRLDLEGALIAGRSTRPFGEESQDGVLVLSGGGIARLRYEDPARRLSARLDLGAASGDGDSRDGTATAFAFHPDFRPGLLLSDQVLSRLSLRAIDRLADPGLLGTPPPSLRFLATQGAVTNALFMNLVARWRPVEAVELRLGYLAAAAPAGVTDPYATALEGGYPTDARGNRPSQGLGHELDAAVRWRVPFGPGLAVRLGADAGLLLPSSGLSPVLSSPVAAARLLADLEY